MVPVEKRELEEWLADRFDRDHCVLVGRATTGIALALDAAGVTGEVVVPTYTCSSPAYAVRYADATPTFADVDGDYTLSPASLERQISDETDAVIAIHLFGHPAEMTEIQSTCSANDVVLIEDACQALGTTYRGRTAGSFGDISVFSFGHKKHIDAGGGGAILTDDGTVARRVREGESDVPVRDADRLGDLYDHYREIYYAIEDLVEIHPPAERLYGPFPEVFRELYLRGYDPAVADGIASGFETLSDAIATRKAHADRYRDGIQHPRVKHPSPRGDPSYFRYTIQFDSKALRDHVVSSLREQDIHVSTLYAPLHPQFGDSSAYPTATDLAARSANLWVTPRVDEEYVSGCIDAVTESIIEFNDD